MKGSSRSALDFWGDGVGRLLLIDIQNSWAQTGVPSLTYSELLFFRPIARRAIHQKLACTESHGDRLNRCGRSCMLEARFQSLTCAVGRWEIQQARDALN